MSIIRTAFYHTPYGKLILGDFEGNLCLCDWQYRKMRDSIDNRICKSLNATYRAEETILHRQAKLQLEAYFSQEISNFDIPLLLIGSGFQKTIWGLLQSIPYGETSTYMELSRKYGDEKAVRAVASANGANAISIIVPCHRVVGSDLKMVGYAGGIATKQKLLQLEGARLNASQLKIFE